MKRISKQDLEHILNHTQDLWMEQFVKGSTLFITGGTGFIGKWLMESFTYISERLKLDAKLIVLSRNPDSFLKQFPQFKIESVKFIKGDIRTFDFPVEKIDYIIHAATEASVSLNLEEPLLMYDTIVEGTKRILELAKQKNVKAIVHTSSGAVYGKQPPELSNVPEDYKGSPDVYGDDASYGEGKRVAEMLSSFYFKKYNTPSKIARCFAFAGPYLPLDTHFAVGNFVKNIVEGDSIKIEGDGTPYRSYLYTSDLAIWLWTIMLKGKNNYPYNVGSDVAISIEELAQKMIRFSTDSKASITIAKPKTNKPALRYVPAVDRAKRELGLKISVDIDETLKKMVDFYRSDSNNLN